MIGKAISLSERVDNLQTIEAKLFFTWGIIHTDDFGLLPISVKKLKAIICPHWDNTIDDISNWIIDIIDKKLWVKINFNEEEFYFVINFFEHQNLRKDINPKLWSSRGSAWEDFDKIKNQIDGNLFSSIGKKSEITPIKKKVKSTKRIPRASVEDVKTEILNHKQFSELEKQYPYRKYEMIIEDMCEWWKANKKSLPKVPILAFKNWLARTKPDDDLLDEKRGKFFDEQNKKMKDIIDNTKPSSKKTLDKLKKMKKSLVDKMSI